MTSEPIKKIKSNPWILTTIILAIIVLLMGIVIYTNNSSSKKVGNDFIEFINAQGQTTVEFIDAEDYGSNLYQVTVANEGQESPVYLTKDGKYWVQIIASITGKTISEQTSKETPQIKTAEKPKAELFVMTHCPYGTQAEKGFIPAMKELEKVADVSIKFVHYYMHTNKQEEVETPRQICIREEQADKFLDYLECFLGGTSGTSEEAKTCETQVGINTKALNECISSGRAEKYYEEDSKLSESYGVKGSPTLVINGEIAQFGRDSQSYLEGICLGFNEMPELCNTAELSTASPSPGFGYGTSSGSTTAQC